MFPGNPGATRHHGWTNQREGNNAAAIDLFGIIISLSGGVHISDNHAVGGFRTAPDIDCALLRFNRDIPPVESSNPGTVNVNVPQGGDIDIAIAGSKNSNAHLPRNTRQLRRAKIH